MFSPSGPARLSLALLAAALLVTGCAGSSSEPAPVAAVGAETSDAFHGREPDPVPTRASFTLTDTEGQPYDFLAETAGRPTFVYFGYTSCPDECPTAMADVAAALRRTDAALREQARVVFITTDPERDTPAVLRDWLASYGDDVVGLTGTQEQVDAAQQAVGIRAAVRGGPQPTLPGRPNEHPGDEGTAPHSHSAPLGYAVDHTNVLFAYDADDRLPVLYPAGVTASDLAADLPRLARPQT